MASLLVPAHCPLLHPLSLACQHTCTLTHCLHHYRTLERRNGKKGGVGGKVIYLLIFLIHFNSFFFPSVLLPVFFFSPCSMHTRHKLLDLSGSLSPRLLSSLSFQSYSFTRPTSHYFFVDWLMGIKYSWLQRW